MEAKAIVFLLVVIASFYANAMAQERRSMQLNSGRIIDGDQTRIRRTFYGGPIGEILHGRMRRSPNDDRRGSVVLSGTRTEGQFGRPSQSSVRGDYNHNLWRGKNGATVDANAFYQRNRGGGPKEDYGGGIRASIPFGRR
ncbi:hypothetical protein LSTR_LSTR011198 [Laodelphax striatellus]|uniref:Attacin C-terminal domain-containing protein n=1 Tax=Laodelphax striatellus TaxID=195883 RepID=A0A482X4I6_LAOST|nr:hypothetical protein LSTR_LSTR011198 [Laodelphax striatellus]